VTLKASEVFETVIPTKMLEFMSCARPVILAVKGQAQRVLEAAGGGICIEPEDVQALCAAILRLRQLPALRAEMGRSGRSYILRELSRERTAQQYLGVLAKLTGELSGKAAVAA
jgi:glycosyltransferase involved in cell wall biosynthesis